MGTITINVLGKEYSIKSDVEADSLNQIAGYLNGKVDEIIKTTKTVSTHNVLILAAMSIALFPGSGTTADSLSKSLAETWPN